ncbi:LuxR C-terminal-related transcriptional regulator [Nitrobacter sp.]|uniref:LuxR C-terminal-related transcriptional regulator n=1 Tax=Nitrobacter sp. TaxID=29420 RepID=UPI003F650BC9
MDVENVIGEIETCNAVSDLMARFQAIIEDFGFAEFNFLDAGQPDIDNPLSLGTVSQAWEREYRQNNFVHVDPMLPVVRRRNLPFTWGKVKLPDRVGRRKPGAIKTMEAARDHGFTDGFVIPFHYADPLGRPNLTLCVLFWRDPVQKLQFLLSQKRHELHVVAIYFLQRAVDLLADRMKSRMRFADDAGRPLFEVTLTDRERDVLSWAARGKTMEETSDILSISTDTVQTHIENAKRKLGASNKLHAVVKAVYIGAIDV